jgi:hypothetical protein
MTDCVDSFQEAENKKRTDRMLLYWGFTREKLEEDANARFVESERARLKAYDEYLEKKAKNPEFYL